MKHHERLANEPKPRNSSLGTLAMGLMCALFLIVGSTSLQNHPATMLALSLLICPLAGWMATRCLRTAGTASRLHAWIALGLIAAHLGWQLVTYFPILTATIWN